MDLTATLTLGALALEMRPRLDVIEAAAVFEAHQRWPLGHFLPLKRCTDLVTSEADDDLSLIELGVMRRGDGPVLTDSDGVVVEYPSFEAMARDGWRPD